MNGGKLYKEREEKEERETESAREEHCAGVGRAEDGGRGVCSHLDATRKPVGECC